MSMHKHSPEKKTLPGPASVGLDLSYSNKSFMFVCHGYFKAITVPGCPGSPLSLQECIVWAVWHSSPTKIPALKESHRPPALPPHHRQVHQYEEDSPRHPYPSEDASPSAGTSPKCALLLASATTPRALQLGCEPTCCLDRGLGQSVVDPRVG